MNEFSESAVLDATGLKCPLPVLRARKAIKPLEPGQILKMIANDPAARRDVPAFCKTTGHELLAIDSADKQVVFWIKKADA